MNDAVLNIFTIANIPSHLPRILFASHKNKYTYKIKWLNKESSFKGWAYTKYQYVNLNTCISNYMKGTLFDGANK